MASNDFILSALLECGTLDIDFIDNLENDFGEWNGWDNLRQRIIDEQITANDIIHEIFYSSLQNACKEYEINSEDVEYNIYANCLDSSFYIKDENGYSERIYDKKQLSKFLKANYIHPFELIESLRLYLFFVGMLHLII